MCSLLLLGGTTILERMLSGRGEAFWLEPECFEPAQKAKGYLAAISLLMRVIWCRLR